MPATAFTDPDLVHTLYARAERLAQRTRALHAAKISGEDATATIVNLAARSAPTAPVVCDIGCGRGTTTLALARRLTPSRLVALDQSPALLGVVRDRLAQANRSVETVCADFHQLPWHEASVDVAVAAFCLYHCPHPEQVAAEIARCLTPAGAAVLVTKSADSYHEIDQLIAETGLDPRAGTRQSLYDNFHSDTASEIAATALRIEKVVHQRHVFRFDGLDHLAAYVATSPQYQLAEHLTGEAAQIAEELRSRIADRPVTATSTVTYVVAARS
ncbi:MAG: class I SAM-dependent methyltransferase [Pseudonocardiaceae bacterium]